MARIVTFHIVLRSDELYEARKAYDAETPVNLSVTTEARLTQRTGHRPEELIEPIRQAQAEVGPANVFFVFDPPRCPPELRDVVGLSRPLPADHS